MAIPTGVAATTAPIGRVIRRMDVRLTIVRRTAEDLPAIVRLRTEDVRQMAAGHRAEVARRILQGTAVRRINRVSPVNPEIREAVGRPVAGILQVEDGRLAAETQGIPAVEDRQVVAILQAEESRPRFSLCRIPASPVSRVVSPEVDGRRFSPLHRRGRARSRTAAIRNRLNRRALRFSPRRSRVQCRPADAPQALAATRVWARAAAVAAVSRDKQTSDARRLRLPRAG